MGNYKSFGDTKFVPAVGAVSISKLYIFVCIPVEFNRATKNRGIYSFAVFSSLSAQTFMIIFQGCQSSGNSRFSGDLVKIRCDGDFPGFDSRIFP